MKEISGNRCVRLLLTLLFCCLLLSTVTAWAQSTTDGAIGGTVVDPQDKVIPGAGVTVKNTANNQTFTTRTDQSGFYRVGQLQPASYTVTVDAKGFAPYKAEKVVVTVGSLTPVNPHMTIGATEQVEVTAETPLVNVTSADFAPTLNETQIENLPINGGRWSSFVMLTPGVVSDSSGFGLVSFRGMSTLLNNVTVDGADNNQAYFSEERGRTRAGYSTAKVAVQEFQVNTSNYSSEYGRSAGGVINTVTKSGTNTIHGEAFWYDRDNAVGSMNPFTTVTTFDAVNQKAITTPYKPIDVRKMGGFGVGGPAIKDRLFWFVGFDRFHRNFPGTALPNSATSFFAVPDAALPAGKVCGTKTGSAAPSAADANVCTLSSYTGLAYGDAQALWMKSMFGNTTTLGLISETGPTPRTGDQDIFFPKLDWIINQRNHVSIAVNRMRWWSPAGIQTQATNNYGIRSFGNDYVKNTWGVVKLDTMLSNNVSNQIRMQYGRDFEFETNQEPSAYDKATLLTGKNNPFGIPPNIYIGSFQWGSTLYGNRVAYPNEYKAQFADTISITTGKHNLRFGIDYMNSYDKLNSLYQQYGEFSYSGLPDYFADLYNPALKRFSNYYQSFQGTSASNPVKTYSFSTNDWAFFGQDDWKLTRRLTVNLGLRFETELLPTAYKNVLNTVTVGTKTITAGALPNNTQNWGPRLGFAYDVTGNGKTVVRGGWGLYYGRITNSALFSGMTNTGSSNGQNSFTLKYSNAAAPTFPNVLTTAPTTTGTQSIEYFDPNMKTPKIQEVDLTVQRELGYGMVLSASYLGSFGKHLQSFNDINLADPGSSYCVKSNAQVACGTTGSTSVTPLASWISYTVNNGTVAKMPLANGTTFTLPFYTSRLNPVYGTVSEIFSGINSNYNALAIQLEKRMSHHVQFSVNYTWSHALDYGMNNTTTVSTGASNMIDPKHPGFGMYGNSLTNVPNRFTANAILQAPWQHKGWLKYAIDGWQAAPMVQMQNGLGNTMSVASSYPLEYVGTTQVGNLSTQPGGMLAAGGSYQVPGTERNGYRQPATYVTDLRASKIFPIAERYKLEFSADVFNFFNHRNVTGVSSMSPYTVTNPAKPASTTPSTTITSPTLTPNSNAINNLDNSSLWMVPSTANSNFVYSTRQMQFGLRLMF